MIDMGSSIKMQSNNKFILGALHENGRKGNREKKMFN